MLYDFSIDTFFLLAENSKSIQICSTNILLISHYIIRV